TILNLVLALSLAVPVLAAPGIALAATPSDCPGGSTPQGQALTGIGQTGCDDSGVQKVVHAVINILSLVVGIIAVVMIINSGLKYITSGGDAQKVANAKGTLIYALIGVAIAALAQVLVHFVLFQTNNAVG
ncbi:MAG TPA: pilin, partial [Candidatus Saccharimonadales bacterium]|nr:pilin [Candidatus Saccharimonadales bacterium]